METLMPRPSLLKTRMTTAGPAPIMTTSNPGYEIGWNKVPLDWENNFLAFDTETAVRDGQDLHKEIPDLVTLTVTDGKRVVILPRQDVALFVAWHSRATWVGFNVTFDYWVVHKLLVERSEER